MVTCLKAGHMLYHFFNHGIRLLLLALWVWITGVLRFAVHSSCSDTAHMLTETIKHVLANKLGGCDMLLPHVHTARLMYDWAEIRPSPQNSFTTENKTTWQKWAKRRTLYAKLYKQKHRVLWNEHGYLGHRLICGSFTNFAENSV